MRIASLKENPAWADIIANRCWHAWWTDSGVSLTDYRAGMDAMISGNGIPLALVAHDEGRYLGSVFLIDNDLDARPTLKPWIAALWVEPSERRRGIASQLIQAAREEARRLEHATGYLCATEDKTAFYLSRGFRLIERDVDGLNVFMIPSQGEATEGGSKTP
ncbi:GNAT family N-acetyltransferase [Oryzibacter oryziterrae]|uniref:GNAT family N-acetyltransferase n=1 Tax=Oryzibacter oryziterrae TaxID=2766474 RepID=UPI001F3C06A9|nr:GNAT family N-acetyltransferase [Oryzibacter oryziterrae]